MGETVASKQVLNVLAADLNRAKSTRQLLQITRRDLDEHGAYALTIEKPCCGLKAFIVFDAPALGPAVGGIRTSSYETDDAALA